MRIPIASNKDPMVLALTLKAKQPTDVRIRVADANKPNSSYTDRIGTINGTKKFYIRMPKTGRLILADIFNPAGKPTDPDNNIELVNKEILSLPTFPSLYRNTPLIKEGFEFIQWFSEKCGVLSAGMDGSVYMSKGNHFRIDYLTVIRDRRKTLPVNPKKPDGPQKPNPNYNRELTTPARISQDRGIIEVSQKYFIQKPIPERVGILAHEISHFYLNEDQHSEEEADENAINMFLGHGYGYIDAENAFLEVFKNADTPQNRERYNKLNDQIIRIEKTYNKLK